MSSGNSHYVTQDSHPLTSPDTPPLGDLLDNAPLQPPAPKPKPELPRGRPEIMAWAANQTHPELGHVAYGVLLVIARFATAEGIAWPAINTIRQLAGRSAPTVRVAIDRMETLGILQIVERGGPRRPHHYRLGWAWSSDRTRVRSRDPEIHTPTKNAGYESLEIRNTTDVRLNDYPYHEEERERYRQIEDLMVSILSLLPPEVCLRISERGYESLGIRNSPVGGSYKSSEIHEPLSEASYESPGIHNPTAGEPMIQQATLHDEEVTQHRLRAEWLDEHWPWVQENTAWRDLGGAEKHFSRFPREFRRMRERYEAAQDAAGEDAEEKSYQVVDPDAENQEEAQSVWGQVLESMKEQVPKPTFTTYLQETEGHALDMAGGVLQVVCPSVWVAQAIERRLYGSVAKQAERVVGVPVEVYFVTKAVA